MKSHPSRIAAPTAAWWLGLALIIAPAGTGRARGQQEPPFVAPGPNLALGQPYTLAPAPNYGYCTDPGDGEQLTDGQYVGGTGVLAVPQGLFWTQTGCVGWAHTGVVTVTLDLGAVAPIAGLSFSSAAGAADVGWPSAILILVSDDGQNFHYVGELTARSAKFGVPAPFTLQQHRFRCDDLRTRARFLRLAVVTGRMLFCDEIEVYEGAPDLLAAPVKGDAVGDVPEFLAAHRTGLPMQSRIALDLARARQELAAADLAPAVRERLNEQWQRLDEANQTIPEEPGPDYHAVFPLNSNQARLFEWVAELRRHTGGPELFLWHHDRWETLGLWDTPGEPPESPPELSVRLMQNERRAETLNVAHYGPQTVTATVSFAGLPGGPAPDYVTVHAAEYVATAGGYWNANALPRAPGDAQGWHITLPTGVSRQLWLSFYPQDAPGPGRYEGAVLITMDETGERLTAPLTLVVEPIRFPEQTRLALTMWDYAHDGGAYDLNPGNIPAALAHMQSHHYNAPWATSGVFPWTDPGHFDAQDHLVTPPDFSAFDRWVASWPRARYYLVFATVGGSFAGAEASTEPFQQRVGAVMRAWANHARDLGVDPGKIALLLIDEPSTDQDDEWIVAWARAIKAAAPELLIFEDPIRANPAEHLREMLEICDILCPGRSNRYWDYAAFWEELRAGGRELWVYSDSDPSTKSARSFLVDGWNCWRANATGTGYWSYGDAGGFGNSWNQLAARGPIFSPVYIDSGSVTDSKVWLAINEGIQDYEYLRLLRDRVDELAAAGRADEALARAREMLTRLPAAVYQGDVSCEQGRLQVLEALLALR